MSIGELWRRYRYFWLLLILVPMVVFAGWYIRGLFLLRQFETESGLEGATIWQTTAKFSLCWGRVPAIIFP